MKLVKRCIDVTKIMLDLLKFVLNYLGAGSCIEKHAFQCQMYIVLLTTIYLFYTSTHDQSEHLTIENFLQIQCISFLKNSEFTNFIKMVTFSNREYR